jgi:hypothetical protein
MIGKLRIEKGMAGSGRGIFSCNIPEFSWKN